VRVPFWKVCGAGNDFVLVDSASVPSLTGPALARRLCPRRGSIGADGLLVVRAGRADKEQGAPAALDYYNADGSRAFCGNGARCALLWIFAQGRSARKAQIRTGSCLLSGEILAWDARRGRGRVRVSMPPARIARRLRLKAAGRAFDVLLIDSGVPHAVARVARLETLDVLRFGRALRRHPAFLPGGANADFIRIGRGSLRLRTYERGVEDETLACGTGAAAAAVAAHAWSGLRSPVRVLARGGALHARFAPLGPSRDAFSMQIEGPAEITFQGEVRL